MTERIHVTVKAYKVDADKITITLQAASDELTAAMLAGMYKQGLMLTEGQLALFEGGTGEEQQEDAQ